jgi:lysozyme family protein
MTGISRRTAMGKVIAVLATTQMYGRAFGQPAEPSWVEELSVRLRDLERSADAAGLLAKSGTRAGIPRLTTSNAYVEGLPRLVDIIDRAGVEHAEIGDQAGELLGALHARERFGKAELSGRPGTRAPKPRLDALKDEYLRRFAECKIRPEYGRIVNWYVQTIRTNQKRYASVSERGSVPWYFIAIIHGLEASFNFRAHLHNGDYPLTQRTRSVPKDRPINWMPPSDWESSAVDALTLEGFTGQNDWDLAHLLYRWETFNGFGYRSRGIPTPYLWSFSNHYSQGKFTADGKFDSAAPSKQCGAAVMLKSLVNANLVKL